jgi:hypothetical protein
MALVFWVLLAISFCCLYVALRARSWPFALAALILASPTALVASLPLFRTHLALVGLARRVLLGLAALAMPRAPWSRVQA